MLPALTGGGRARRFESNSRQHSYQRNLLRFTAVDIWERALLLIQLLERFFVRDPPVFRSVAMFSL